MAEKEKDIAEKAMEDLKSRGVTGDCPRCSQHGWTLEVASLSFTQGNADMALMACKNCGFISMHYLAALGLKLPHSGTEAIQVKP